MYICIYMYACMYVYVYIYTHVYIYRAGSASRHRADAARLREGAGAVLVLSAQPLWCGLCDMKN